MSLHVLVRLSLRGSEPLQSGREAVSGAALCRAPSSLKRSPPQGWAGCLLAPSLGPLPWRGAHGVFPREGAALG